MIIAYYAIMKIGAVSVLPNPDADFVLLPDDLIAIIGSERDREAFLFMASSKP